MARGRRGRGGRGRLVLASLLAILLLGGAAGAFLLFRHDPGRDRRERAVAASRAMEDGDWDRARLILARLAAEDPENRAIRRNLLVCLLRLDRLDEAGALARKTLELAPDDEAAHAALSLLHRRDGRLADALREARLAAAAPHASESSRYALADLLLEAGRVSEALTVLGEAEPAGEDGNRMPPGLLRLLEAAEPGSPAATAARTRIDAVFDRARGELAEDPADPERVAAFAELALRAGRPEEALRALTAVPVHRELTRDESLLLARACSETGLHERAMEILDRLGGPAGEAATPAAAVTRALVHLEADEPERALAALDGAPAAAAASPDRLRLRVRILARLLSATVSPTEDRAARLADALDTADALLDARPEDEAALALRAAARLERGEPVSALADARALLRVAPDSPRGAWLAGLALLRTGEARSALLYLRRGRAVQPADALTTLLRAAVLSGDADAVAALAPDLPEESVALRAAASAAVGDADRAAELAADEAFSLAPPADRALAATALAAAGRTGLAKRIASALPPDPPSRLLRANVLFSAGDPEGARRELAAVAAGEGPAADAALSRLAEGAVARAVAGEPADDADDLLARLEKRPGGAAAAEILRARREIAGGRTDEAAGRLDRAARLGPDSPALREARLALAIARGDPPAELRDAAQAVLDLLPAHPGARRTKAAALVRLLRGGALPGRDETEAMLEEAVDLAPDVAAPRVLRGLFGVTLGDLDTAEEDARTLLDGDAPGAGELLLGLVRYRQVRLEEAARHLRAAAKLLPDAPEPLLALGHVELALGRPDEALAAANAARDRGGSPPATTYLAASAHLAAGRADGAVDLVRARSADDPEVRPLLPFALLAAGRPGGAADAFAPLVAAHPERMSFRAGLVRSLIASGREDEARTAADAAASAPELGADGLLLRSQVRGRLGDRDGELADLKAAIARDPASARARLLHGRRLIRDHDLDGATAELRRAAALDERDPRSRLHLALLADDAGRRTEALALYEEVLRRQPGNAPAANNLAYRLADGPHDAAGAERAVALARRAVDLAPENAEYLDTLAFTLSVAGSKEEAADTAARALALGSGNPFVAVRAAELFRDAGRDDEARAAAARAEVLAAPEETEAIRRRISRVLRSLGD